TDAGLKMKHIDATGELEISTERAFMEPKVAQILEQLPAGKPMITYFVKGIERSRKSDGRRQEAESGRQNWHARLATSTTGDEPRVLGTEGVKHTEPGISKSEESDNPNQSLSIPYSFVSSLDGSQLADNEILLTQWAADDLNANLGDSIK